MGRFLSCRHGEGFGLNGGRLYPEARWCQRALVAVVLVLAAGCAGNQEAVRRRAQSFYQLGGAYLREGKTTLALQEFSKAEALAPDDPEVLNAFGLAYWRRQEPILAEQKFRRATALKPDYSEAWNNLGALCAEQGRYDAAVPAFENALTNVMYNTREFALTNLGWSLYKTGRTAEAEKRLREAMDLAPDFPLTHKRLGMILQDRGNHGGAVAQFEESLRVYADDAEAHLLKGVSLFKLGRREEARNAFDRAWHLAPGADTGRSAKTYLDMLQ